MPKRRPRPLTTTYRRRRQGFLNPPGYGLGCCVREGRIEFHGLEQKGNIYTNTGIRDTPPSAADAGQPAAWQAGASSRQESEVSYHAHGGVRRSRGKGGGTHGCSLVINLICLIYLIYLICLIHLMCLIYLIYLICLICPRCQRSQMSQSFAARIGGSNRRNYCTGISSWSYSKYSAVL